MKKLNRNFKISLVVVVVSAMERIYETLLSLKEDAYFADLMAKIKSDLDIIVSATRADKIASELEASDIERDDIVRKLGTLIDGWSVMPDERAEKGKVLSAVFSKFGKQIAAAPYAQESLLVKSLLSDLSAEKCAAAVKDLDGVSYYIKALEAAQAKFDAASDSYRDAKIGKGENATDAKKRLMNAVNTTLATYVTAMVASRGGDYKIFADKVDAEIDKAAKQQAKPVSQEAKPQPQAVSQGSQAVSQEDKPQA